MNEKNRTILSLIRFARKHRTMARHASDTLLYAHSLSYEENELHISNGRKLFPAVMSEVHGDGKEYVVSYYWLNIDGIPFKFYWLTRLT